MTGLITAIATWAIIIVKQMFNPSTQQGDIENRKTVYDQSQNYLEVVNKFIYREFTYELSKWITGSKAVREISSGSNQFVNEITDTDTLQPKLAKMTSLFIAKMSKDVKNAFYRVYSKSFKYIDETSMADLSSKDGTTKKIVDSDVLYMYVARQLLFLIRKSVVDITSYISSGKSSDEAVNLLLIKIENEIYNTNDIGFTQGTKENN